MNTDEWYIRITEFAAISGCDPLRLIAIAVDDGSMWPQTAETLTRLFT